VTTDTETAQHTNRLIHETSPYLRQHARNPVDWFPWGEEAFAKAKQEDKPICLSIGYAACHWCHGMAHESFEDEKIAAYLNERFINIKVDREERPDVDNIYMTSVLAMTGSGGWPMSVFLTPDLKPFYAGTYFPPANRYGHPGFLTLLKGIVEAWENRRDDVARSADNLTQRIEQHLSGLPAETTELNASLLENATAQLQRTYDPHDGGWGSAPKFPSSPAIALLLREQARTGDDELGAMATHTLDTMAQGGIHDHLGGGFHRYSVDAEWLVPHFEKMLYDNAQLSRVYLEAYQQTGEDRYRRVAEGVFEYVLRDMRDEAGGFYSAEDADSEGQEGKFYLWSQAEVLDVLGEDDGKLFSAYYNVRPAGNFSSHEPYHTGMNILHVTRPLAEVAQELELSAEALEQRLAAGRQQLLERRERRVRPGLDDKVLTSWNALMITALAQGAQILQSERYAQAAAEAGRFLRDHMTEGGTLLRTYRQGESRLPGYLDDYAFTANAFVDLYEATFDLDWLEAADGLAQQKLERFWDAEGGTFFFTGEEHKNLIVRSRPTFDGSEPSGNSMAALALLRLAKLLDKPDYDKTARQVLERNAAMMRQAPQGFLKMLCAVHWVLNPPKEVAIVGPKDREDTQALLKAAHRPFTPNKVVALLDPEAQDTEAAQATVPLLRERVPVDNTAAAYVCKDFACDLPVTDPNALVEKLAEGQRA